MTIRSFNKQRFYIGIALFVSVFVLPSIVTLVIGALLTLRYSHYYELPVAALLIDALYRPYGYAVIGLFGFAVLYVVFMDHLRIRIRMRDNRRLY